MRLRSLQNRSREHCACKAGKAAWTVSGLTLLFMPKCPACLTAWIGIASGIAISIETAAALKQALVTTSTIIFSLVSLVAVLRFALQSRR